MGRGAYQDDAGETWDVCSAVVIDDLTPKGDAGFDETLEAGGAAQSEGQQRSPSHQRLHEEVRGRLFEGRAPTRSIEPGTLIAGRYRIVGLLGAGGMGEVFRARDLVLDEDVAMKFLPESRAHDDAFMRRFVNEVRLARQISHPSVCRVHDIGEVEGRAFLSMEYIDGEDLATLLRRIGRLPPEKGYELAQQLCAGLAELHGAGLLHRDLKPANIMIDSQGRLKLADFGLAAAREALRAHEYGDGTPAYMAPEQLSGRAVSERSDIYALGVVLYELLSGRHPHEPRDGTLSERGGIDRRQPTVSLGARVTGLADETLEIIDTCLAEDPEQRPASVLDVAAALHGGDPIAAALRAGRAPSVDAVANAKSASQLRPWQSWALALVSLVVLLLYASLGPSLTQWGLSAPQLAPSVLEDRARDVLRAVGVDPPSGSQMHRLLHDPEFSTRNDTLVEGGPVPVLYEYRASPGKLMRSGATVTATDPPMVTPGEVRVVLDVQGRLRSIERVPEIADGGAGVDWSGAFERARISRTEPVTPERVPPFASDQQEAWQASMDELERHVRVDAASWRGAPVWFRVEAPWADPIAEGSASTREQDLVQLVVVLVFFTVLVLLARRMVARGEVDGRGAFRVAAVLVLCVTLSELLTGAVGQASRVQTVFGALQEGLLIGLIALLGYAVVEPYGRRFLPGVMVSLIRLTRGRWHDPAVGRDVLVGAAYGCFIAAVVLLRSTLLGGGHLYHVRLDALIDVGHAIGAGIGVVWIGAFSVMQVYVLFLALRWLVRRTPIAVVAFVVLWTLLELSRASPADPSATKWLIATFFAVVVSLLVVDLIARRGLLALSAAQVMLNLLLTLPLNLDLSGWYAPASVVGLGTTALLVLGGLRVALGRASGSERTSRTSPTRA